MDKTISRQNSHKAHTNKYEDITWIGSTTRAASSSNYFRYKNYKLWSIHKYISKGKDFKVLDAGCSTGELVHFVHEFKKSSVYGIDISKKAIEIARKRYPKYNFKVGSVDDLPYKDDYFDYIICYDILEHVDNPRLVLDEFRRVLAPGGHLIIEYETADRYNKGLITFDKKNFTKSSWIHAGQFQKEFDKRFVVKKHFWGGQLLTFGWTSFIINKSIKILPLFSPIYAFFELLIGFVLGHHMKGTWYFVCAKKQ